MITEAAAHNIDIFTEKPVDETAQKVKHLFDICNEANVSLCCGFQRRFDDSYRATQQAISCGKIGKPLHANFFFADHPTPPKEFLLTGGDIFYDLSAHDVDYIRWCLNDEVVSVYATGTSSSKELEEAGVHDNATVVMNFKRGMTFCISHYVNHFIITLIFILLYRSCCTSVFEPPRMLWIRSTMRNFRRYGISVCRERV